MLLCCNLVVVVVFAEQPTKRFLEWFVVVFSVTAFSVAIAFKLNVCVAVFVLRTSFGYIRGCLQIGIFGMLPCRRRALLDVLVVISGDRILSIFNVIVSVLLVLVGSHFIRHSWRNGCL